MKNRRRKNTAPAYNFFSCLLIFNSDYTSLFNLCAQTRPNGWHFDWQMEITLIDCPQENWKLEKSWKYSLSSCQSGIYIISQTIKLAREWAAKRSAKICQARAAKKSKKSPPPVEVSACNPKYFNLIPLCILVGTKFYTATICAPSNSFPRSTHTHLFCQWKLGCQ